MTLLDELNLGWGARLPMVLQTEAAECGLACLAMVAGYHGQGSNLAELRRRFGLSLKGATLQDLVRIADQLGLASRPVRLELDELRLLKTPCILHWDLNHFVVLKGVSRNGIVIHDPGVGVRRLRLSEVSKRFSGVALELTPTGGFQPAQAAPRVQLRALLGRLVGLKAALGQLFLLALAIEVCTVVSPFFIQWVVDHALVTADRDLLLTLALGFSLLLLIRTAVSAMRGWMLIALGASLTVQGRANLFSHLIRLPAAYFATRHLGDVMSRFGSQETILQAITTDVVEALLDGLMAGITAVVMCIFAPGLAVMVLAGALLYGLLRWAAYTPLREASAEAIVWAARRDSHFLETLRGIQAIKLFNGQEGRRAHWLNLLVETVNRQLTTQKMHLLFRTANSLLLGVLAILVVWLGAQRVLEHTFSVGMLLAFIAYKDQFLGRVSNLTDKALDLRMLGLHAERLADIALTPPEPRSQSADLVCEPLPASVEVRNLRFRYSDNDPWVLDGVTFRIEPGESVAIVGPSGCGKTTLLKLLASLLQPSAGEILVDGQPLARVGIERYRSMLGVVMQDDHLFAGSIADNISFFSAHPDPQRIEQCAKLAAVHDDILAMPMGYHTLIGDMGTVLSGGQKQRVLIARALYHQPSILLLDEATSHLDISREGAVNAAIGATQVTRVIVAHRPETIRSADRVIVLDQGQVVSGQKGPADSEEQCGRHTPSPVPKPTPRAPLRSPRQQAQLPQTVTEVPTSTPQASRPQRPDGGAWTALIYTRLASATGRRLGAGLLARWGGVLGGRRALSSAGYGTVLIAMVMGLAGMLMLMRGLPQPSPGELPPHSLRWWPLQAFYQAPAGEPFVFPLPPLAHTPAGRPVDVTLEASGDAPSWLQLDRERLSIGGTAPLVAEDRTYRLMIRAHAGRGGDGRLLVWLRIIGRSDRSPVTSLLPHHRW